MAKSVTKRGDEMVVVLDWTGPIDFPTINPSISSARARMTR
jgi:hypothetical protein